MSQVILFTGTSNFVSVRAIGAYQVASILRNSGYSVQVIDHFSLILYYYGIEKIKEIISAYVTTETLWIGISTTFLSPNMLLDKNIRASAKHFLTKDNLLILSDEDKKNLKEFTKSINPNTKWLAGGSRAWVLDEGYSLIDYYIEGYAENSIIELTNYLKGKNPFLPKRKNRDESVSIIHDRKANSFDFTSYEFKWHDADLIDNYETLPIEISRGCIFKCKFCSYPLNGKNKFDYIKNTDILLKQFIYNYEKYHTTNYVFLDDTYNDSPYKVNLLYEKVFSKLPFQINWASYVRLDLLSAHPETIDILYKSGLRSVFFGIESLNYKSNKSVGKGMRPEKIYNILKTIKEKWPNTILRGGFILGLPYDDENTIRSWFSELLDDGYPLDSLALAVLQIFPTAKKFLSAPWFNDIELNPSQYGYTLEGKRDIWTNNLGLNKIKATEIHSELIEKMYDKNKFGWDWDQSFGLLNLGYKDLDTVHKIKVTKDVYDTEKISDKVNIMLDFYLQKLLSFPKII